MKLTVLCSLYNVCNCLLKCAGAAGHLRSCCIVTSCKLAGDDRNKTAWRYERVQIHTGYIDTKRRHMQGEPGSMTCFG